MNTNPQPKHCCCEYFRDETGQRRTQRHACCPRHWREAEHER